MRTADGEATVNFRYKNFDYLRMGFRPTNFGSLGFQFSACWVRFGGKQYFLSKVRFGQDVHNGFTTASRATLCDLMAYHSLG